MKFVKVKNIERSICSIIYAIYNFLSYEYFKTMNVVNTIMGLLIAAIAYTLWQESPKATILPAIFLLALLIFKKILWYIIQRNIRNFGLDEKFIFSRRLFDQEDGSPLCLLNMGTINTIDRRRFSFVKDRDAQLVTAMNLKAFKKPGVWKENDFNKKYLRNLSHIQKNKYSMMFISSFIEDKKLGFTHILPISKWVWDSYLKGKISDNNFGDHLIIPDSGYGAGKNTPYGLIIFTVAFVSYDQELRQSKTFIEDVSHLLENAIAIHVLTYLKTMFKKHSTVKLLIQNMSKEYIDFFKDLAVEHRYISRDKAIITIIEVENPYYENAMAVE